MEKRAAELGKRLVFFVRIGAVTENVSCETDLPDAGCLVQNLDGGRKSN